MTPEPDQRVRKTDRDRIEEIRTGYLQWARWTLWILIALVTIQVGFGIVSIWLYDRINQKFHDTLVIQCLDRNQRHDDGLAELNRLIDNADPKELPPGQKEEIKRNNTILIDKLVPRFENCEARAKAQTRSVD